MALLLLPLAAAAQSERCEENLVFTYDWPEVGTVADHYVSRESNWGNLYLMVRRGVDTWLKAGSVRSMLDGNPATAPGITLQDSIVLSSATPPLAFDVLETGPFASDWAAVALGRSGVGIIGADPSRLSSGNLLSLPITGAITWDVRVLPAQPHLAHILAASGTRGLQIFDFDASGVTLTKLGEKEVGGDARALQTIVGADTLVLVANGQGVKAFRIDATQPQNVPMPSAAALVRGEGRMIVMPGSFDAEVPVWSFDLTSRRWQRMTPPSPGPWGRWGHGAVYDSTRNRVVLYGGGVDWPWDADQYVNPWALDLDTVTWHELRSAGALPDSVARTAAVTIYDPTRDRLVIFGGYDWRDSYSAQYESQTWAFHFPDSAWSVIAGGPGDPHPSARSGAAGVFVPGAGHNRPDRLLLYGGQYPPAGERYRDLWALDLETDTWGHALTFGVPPPPLANHLAIYDDVMDRIVFVGGDTLGGYNPSPEVIYYLDMAEDCPLPGDLLGYWGSYTPPYITLPPRVLMSGVFDPTRSAALIFSGADSTGMKSDLQSLRFADWSWSQLLPELLTPVDSVETPGSAEDVTVWGDTLFVADGLQGVSVIDAGGLHDPGDTTFAVVDTIAVPGYARRVEAVGPYLYVASRSGGLRVYLASNPDSLVASYPRLTHVEDVSVIGWGAQSNCPLDSAFAFVGDEEVFTVLRHEAADVTAPSLAVAPVEKPGIPGLLSLYAVGSECLVDSLLSPGALSARFFFSRWETLGTCPECTTQVAADSTGADTLEMDALDLEERLYASHATYDIRHVLDSLAAAVPGLIQDSLRLSFGWEAMDRAGNTGRGTDSLAVGMIEGAAGGRVPALDPAVSLLAPPGSFAGRGYVYLREEGLRGADGPLRDVQTRILGNAPDPALQGLEPAGPAWRVGWNAPALARPLELVLPIAEGARGAAAGEIGVYVLAGDRWERVGGRVEGGLVAAPIVRAGLYRVLSGGVSGGAGGAVSELFQNVPNPFNPTTVVRYRLAVGGRASLRIYDVQGRLVRTLFDEERPAGEGAAMWRGESDEGRPAAAGVYFYRLESPGGGAETRKMVLLR